MNPVALLKPTPPHLPKKMHLLCLPLCHLSISPGDLQSDESITGDSDREVLHYGSCTNDTGTSAGFLNLLFRSLGSVIRDRASHEHLSHSVKGNLFPYEGALL